MMSISEVEIKAEIKEEISHGLSSEDQSAFEFAQNLPMPEIPCSSVKNISRAQCDTLTKKRLATQSEPLPQRKKNKTTQKLQKCYDCNATFKSKSGLKQHISSIHEGKKTFKCDTCDSTFAQKGLLKTHISSIHEGKKTFKCDICGAYSRTKRKIIDHIRSVHQGKKLLKYNTCSKKIASKELLDIHVASVHEENKVPDDFVNIFYLQGGVEFCCRIRKNLYQCSVCKGKSPGFEQAHEHFIKKHYTKVHEEKKLFQCPLCPYQCDILCSLQKHLSSTHDEKKFQCPICQKKFAKKFNMKLHRETVHEKKKPFKCSECAYATGLSWNLKTHERHVHMM